jgi:hypothetical protein
MALEGGLPIWHQLGCEVGKLPIWFGHASGDLHNLSWPY